MAFSFINFIASSQETSYAKETLFGAAATGPIETLPLRDEAWDEACWDDASSTPRVNTDCKFLTLEISLEEFGSKE
jgi:hypothetical protein